MAIMHLDMLRTGSDHVDNRLKKTLYKMYPFQGFETKPIACPATRKESLTQGCFTTVPSSLNIQ